MSSSNAVSATTPCWRQQHDENLVRRRRELDSSDDVRRADAMAAECRSRLVESIRKVASSSNRSRLGILLSGGVDSCAMLEAAALSKIRFAAAITVVIIDPDNPTQSTPEDELYATEAARLYNEKLSHNMKHSIVRLSPATLIKEYSPPTIKTLALWGYMDCRNSLIISAALHEASTVGLTDVFVGDNADELFGGSYDVYFDRKWTKDLEGWKKKRDGMADLPFVTQKLATTYDIVVHQPFTDQELFVKWALKETGRNDCIAKCNIQSHFGGPYELKACGKLPLREAFCTVASWRKMCWIFAGSGAEEGNILVDHYNTSIGISDEEFKSEQVEYLRKGIKILSKEHLHNIRIFQSVFGGLNHPTKKRFPIGDSRGCVSCCFEIGDEQFCHLCDMYPAQHPNG
mmetsp:Transcript_42560/g.129136  ORF Transcript_42560/g.129136 Transcript_42560/m.129136 type:complete len:402 (-) Transcript_42560:160-1365(-)